ACPVVPCDRPHRHVYEPAVAPVARDVADAIAANVRREVPRADTLQPRRLELPVQAAAEDERTAGWRRSDSRLLRDRRGGIVRNRPQRALFEPHLLTVERCRDERPREQAKRRAGAKR